MVLQQLPLVHQKPLDVKLMNGGDEDLFHGRGGHMTLLVYCEGRHKQRTDAKKRKETKKQKRDKGKHTEMKTHFTWKTPRIPIQNSKAQVV